MLYFEVMAALMLIVGPWQIRDCLITRRIAQRRSSPDILRDERPRAFWAYIGLYCLFTAAAGAFLIFASAKRLFVAGVT